jgi:hypothetical protein
MIRRKEESSYNKKTTSKTLKIAGIKGQKKMNEHVSEMISLLCKTLKGELT